ncbi:hypothetical protein B0H65DRAFT_442543 [Neurospora tetraspora]|uniref:Uncharacterized protein n=1 Tax=Neurospora tetraspora TaxID=94610 RepID=A0AAE0JFP3_9PEZI|nr:hypothetical protein B0H65DRAFT_442543 [Neurospora tetraspora]
MSVFCDLVAVAIVVFPSVKDDNDEFNFILAQLQSIISSTGKSTDFVYYKSTGDLLVEYQSPFGNHQIETVYTKSYRLNRSYPRKAAYALYRLNRLLSEKRGGNLRSPYTSYFGFTNANGYITEWRHLGSEDDTDQDPEDDTNLESEGDAKNIWRMVYFVDASKSDDNSCPIKNPYAGFSILPIADYSVEIIVYGVLLGRSRADKRKYVLS